MKKIAVILSGCGVFDGTEIHEAVLTALHIDQLQAQCQFFAPDIAHYEVIDHILLKPVKEQRSVLKEAARLARGSIKELGELDVNEFDGLIVPGGFGSVKNLSNFTIKKSESAMSILPEFAKTVRSFMEQRKPVGFICITSVMVGQLFAKGAQCTIGNDEGIAKSIQEMGAQHISCEADDIVVDEANKLVSTPAYMVSKSISKIDQGIEKLVKKIVHWKR